MDVRKTWLLVKRAGSNIKIFFSGKGVIIHLCVFTSSLSIMVEWFSVFVIIYDIIS